MRNLLKYLSQNILDTVAYLIKEIISAMIVGTVIREVTLYLSTALRADFGSNLGIMTWLLPTISMAMADERPPIWHNGAVCK
jgi:hypothetical protein